VLYGASENVDMEKNRENKLDTEDAKWGSV